MLDEFYYIIKKLLAKNSTQKFYYKSHLYRYLQREHGLNCKQNTFNRCILSIPEFKNYFESNITKNAVKTEKPFGFQGQFDWKENLNFSFENEDQIKFDIAYFILAASRFKFCKIYPNRSRACIMDFFCNNI